MRVSNLKLWARHPSAFVARVHRAWYDRRHPGEPWIAIGAIRFLETALKPGMTGLEWGSGRSTAWYAGRVGTLVSVEHDPAWHARVAEQLRADGVANADLRLIEMDPDKENGLFHQPDALPRYAAIANEFADSSLDFVVVDGQYRITCAVAAQPKLKPGGLLLVDDEQTFPQLRAGLIPNDWPIVCEAPSGLSRTTIWKKR